MKHEHPINLDAKTVGGILDGDRNRVEVVITVPWGRKRCLPYEPYYIETDDKLLYQDEYGDYHPMIDCCKYSIGDILWVRETWELAQVYWFEGVPEENTYTGPIPKQKHDGFHVYYRADEDFHEVKWRPSVHMPRWASRITLKITEVWAERKTGGSWIWVIYFEVM